MAFAGNAAYCFSKSLRMTLRGAGAAPGTVPEPGSLECLTGMPFGKTSLPERRTFWPSAPVFGPDQCETLRAGLHDAELVVLETSGHAPFADAPEPFRAAVASFFARRGGAAGGAEGVASRVGAP
jgi:pimeloyl-ACP methyl ester carboxylesterase